MPSIKHFSRAQYMPISQHMDDDRVFREDRMGMKVTSGNVTIKKDANNLIGISIGGGAPCCPCLYIVQVFDNSPTFKDGTLQSGDELVGINGQLVKGKTKVEVAKMIQTCEKEVNISYNKLHADPQQGKTLDIVLKKVKHRIVENMSTETADALGLSRAILCNDSLVMKLKELQNIENIYRGLVQHATAVMKSFYCILKTYKEFGDCFAVIGVRDPHPQANEIFVQFGDYHRKMEKLGIQTIKSIKPVLSDLGTYLNKAIPDTKLTIQKYADAKFEYLSYCLKVKEMDDEEYAYASLQEVLYRVDTGNYEYRLILRCRQQARANFAQLRSDVLVKMELLDNKHVQDVVWQLQRFVSNLANYHSEIRDILKNNQLFPIQVDLPNSVLQHSRNEEDDSTENDDLEEEPYADIDKKFEESSDAEIINFDDTELSNEFGNFEIAEDVSDKKYHSNGNNSEDLLKDFANTITTNPFVGSIENTDLLSSNTPFDKFESKISADLNPKDLLLD